MEVKPVQQINTDAERIAFELAKVLVSGQRTQAGLMLQSYAKEMNLTYGVQVAISGIAQAMAAGRKWKKA